jgi:hypothetical protein
MWLVQNILKDKIAYRKSARILFLCLRAKRGKKITLVFKKICNVFAENNDYNIDHRNLSGLHSFQTALQQFGNFSFM